ncbi:MAG: DUF4238 domain-containing protein [Candidatus Microsaccharimonas sp.]
MPEYKNNHYIPQWYQEGFIPDGVQNRSLKYLDLNPGTYTNDDGRVILKRAMHTLGTYYCFSEEDLYTRWFGEERNTQVERVFFGKIDKNAMDSIRYFESYDHTNIDYDAYRNMMPYMGSQRFRTPRGLLWLSEQLGIEDRDRLLRMMIFQSNTYSVIWSECIWQIADANDSETKFIISDNPVTVYNKEIGTHNRTWDREKSDPDPNLFGSHTIFPLTMNKILVLTHSGWAKNPYQSGMRRRPNINPYRNTLFNYTDIQIDRHLSEEEVRQINFILKSKAQKYIAAYKEDWLYPEKYIKDSDWPSFGDGILFLPDARSLNLGGEIIMGFNDGSSYIQDEYGRHPGDPEYSGNGPTNRDWKTLDRIKGEFAHRFGPVRRGRSLDSAILERPEDNPRLHEYHLGLYKPRGSEAKKIKLAEKERRRNR